MLIVSNQKTERVVLKLLRNKEKSMKWRKNQLIFEFRQRFILYSDILCVVNVQDDKVTYTRTQGRSGTTMVNYNRFTSENESDLDVCSATINDR